ncbi:MAG TPA: hypothetical protein VGI64_04635 [Streptosporangiaceae bacterium]|jgi:hypothetical protein
MHGYGWAIASGGWIVLLIAVAFATRNWRPGPMRPSLVLRDEPPAVVSLLAGRIAKDGYPATLLDLAARGRFLISETGPGQVTCRLLPGLHDGQLTDYEQLVLGQLAHRAQGVEDVPGAALASGFEQGDKEFADKFEAQVSADASWRGLIRRRLSGGSAALLAAAGLPGTALAAQAAARGHHPAAWLPVVVYLVLLQFPARLFRGTRLTAAGRRALAEWTAFRAGVAGSRSQPTAGTALLAAAGDRRIAYAVALGAAPAAVSAFAPDGKRLWSSFGGTWHRVSVGSSQEKIAPGILGQVAAVLGMALYAAPVIVVSRAWGARWGLIIAVFPGCFFWGTLLWVFVAAARARGLPRQVEFDGQLLKKWEEEESTGGENSTTCTVYCVAIDDGQHERAWSVRVNHSQYLNLRQGMHVRARIDPRRNKLLELTAARVEA